MLIANSTWCPMGDLGGASASYDAAGLMMYGQMTGRVLDLHRDQGILQGAYETFAALAHAVGRSLAAGCVMTACASAGCGSAQPLAVTMNDGCALCVEVDLQRIERRIETGYLDDAPRVLRRRARAARRAPDGRALSIGLLGNAAEVLPRARPARRASTS